MLPEAWAVRLPLGASRLSKGAWWLPGGVWPPAASLAMRALRRPSVQVSQAAEAVRLPGEVLRPLVAPAWQEGAVLQQAEDVRLAVALRPAAAALRSLVAPAGRVS